MKPFHDRYILEVSHGLAHLHSHGLAHRDIKPGNVLLTHSGHLKIADFGCCARLSLQDDDIVSVMAATLYFSN